MTQITTREFHANQSKYFDLANRGEQVMIRRRNQMFMLTPVKEDELILSPELQARIAKARKDMAEGKLTKVSSKADLAQLLDSLRPTQSFSATAPSTLSLA